jgi:hypothetical protein
MHILAAATTKTDASAINDVSGKIDVDSASILEKLDNMIDMPFPTQIILFHDQTEETDGDRTRQREGWPVGKNPPQSAKAVAALEAQPATE